jgi:hypothetical protein
MKQEARKIRIELELPETAAALLDVLSSRLDKSRDETLAVALRLLFTAIPRPGAGEPPWKE